MADPPEDADFDALMAEMGELQEKIDAVDGWTLDNQLEIAMDALRCPPGDSPVDQPLRRREAPRRADPAAARKARHPAARRADQPSRRRERRNGSKSTSSIIPATSSSSPTTAISSTMSSTGCSSSIAARYYVYEGNYSAYLEKKAKRLEQEEREEAGQAEGDQRRARMDPPLAQGAPGQVQGPHPRLRRAGRGAGEPHAGQGRRS